MAPVSESAAVPIAVVGAGVATPTVAELAAAVGREIARRGGILYCGGRGGVMEHAARGAREIGGTTIGILPGRPEEETPNAHLSHRVFTGLGQARNQVLVLSAAAVVAVGGGWGTLSEIALALKQGIPVVLVSCDDVRAPDGRSEPRLFSSATPIEAVALAFTNARRMP